MHEHETNLPPNLTNQNRTPITVQKFEALDAKRFKLKIKEDFVNMKNVNIMGREFLVTKKLNRGRYILVAK